LGKPTRREEAWDLRESGRGTGQNRRRICFVEGRDLGGCSATNDFLAVWEEKARRRVNSYLVEREAARKGGGGFPSESGRSEVSLKGGWKLIDFTG